eukprot:Hpha_TRINITY_DN2056_c0_g1::TRINITY_DN2056_c0_g1_i1::g.82803::m.82803
MMALLAVAVATALANSAPECLWLLLEFRGGEEVEVSVSKLVPCSGLARPLAGEAAVEIYGVTENSTLHLHSSFHSPLRLHHDGEGGGVVELEKGYLPVEAPPGCRELSVLRRGARHRAVTLAEGVEGEDPAVRAGAAAPPQVEVVQQVAKRAGISVVFLSAGYTAEEESKFWGEDRRGGDVRRAVEVLSQLTEEREGLTSQPWPRYWPLVNAYAVWEASRESGASMPHGPGHQSPPGHQPFCKGGRCEPFDTDNNLDCAYGTPHQKMLNCDWKRVFALGAAVPSASLLVVLVNQQVYGGTGGFIPPPGGAALPGVAVVFNGEDMPALLVHEVGHALGHLSDEYTYGMNGEAGGEDLINCAPHASNVSWRGWIEKGSADPAPSLGCSYDNFYRPTDEGCLMRREAHGMCSVCRQQMVRRLYSVDVDLAAPRCPPPGETVFLAEGEEVMLRVGATQDSFARSRSGVEILWVLPARLDDGRYTPAQKRQPDILIPADGLGTGTHEVVCEITDKTDWVLPADRLPHMTHRALFRVRVGQAVERRSERGACPALNLRVTKSPDEEAGLTLAGVFVLRVTEGAAAHFAGVQEGDVIRAVGEREINNEAEAQRVILEAGGTFNVTVERGFRRCVGMGWADKPYCGRCEEEGGCLPNVTGGGAVLTPVQIEEDLAEKVGHAGGWVWTVGGILLGSAVVALLICFVWLRLWRQKHVREVVVFSGTMRVVRLSVATASAVLCVGCAIVMAVCINQYYSTIVYGQPLILGAWIISALLFLSSFVGFAGAYLKIVSGLVAAAVCAGVLGTAALGLGAALVWMAQNIGSESLKSTLADKWEEAVAANAARICGAQRHFECSGFLHSCHNVGLALPAYCPGGCSVGNTFSNPCYSRLEEYVAENFRPAGAALMCAAGVLAVKVIASGVLAEAITDRRNAMRRRRRRRMAPTSAPGDSTDSSEDERPLTTEEIELLRVEFKKGDKDGSGYLDRKELEVFWRLALHEEPPDGESMSDVISRVDTNGDGRISFEEFVAMYQPFDHRHAAATGKLPPPRSGPCGTWYFGPEGRNTFTIREEAGHVHYFIQDELATQMVFEETGSGDVQWRVELSDGQVWLQHDVQAQVMRTVQRRLRGGEMTETLAYPSRKSCLAAQGLFLDPLLRGDLSPADQRWLRRQWRQLAGGAAVLSARTQLRTWYERLHKRRPMPDELDDFIRVLDAERAGTVKFEGFCTPFKMMRRQQMFHLQRVLGADELKALRGQFGVISQSGGCSLRSAEELNAFYRAYHGKAPPTESHAREAAMGELLTLTGMPSGGWVGFPEFCVPFARRVRRQRKVRQGLDPERVAAIRTHYMRLDSGGNGGLTLPSCRQLYEVVHDKPPTDDDLRTFLSDLDIEGKGRVGFDEVVQYFAETARTTAARRWMATHGATQEEISAQEADFRMLCEVEDGLRMGVTHDGFATLLRSVASQLHQHPPSADEVARYYRIYDGDADGLLDELEFAKAHLDRVISLWRAPPPPVPPMSRPSPAPSPRAAAPRLTMANESLGLGDVQFAPRVDTPTAPHQPEPGGVPGQANLLSEPFEHAGVDDDRLSDAPTVSVGQPPGPPAPPQRNVGGGEWGQPPGWGGNPPSLHRLVELS